MSASQSGIAFSNIPQANLVPLFFVEFSNVNAGVNLTQQPTLLIGQSANAQPAVPVFVPSLGVARNLFGARSMLGRKFSTYSQQDNSGAWCLPAPDAVGAVAATGSIVVTGPATLPGAIALYVAGMSIPVGVNIGDSGTVIAANIAAAINATLDLPLNATSAAGTVTLTAVHGGVQGNNIDIRLNYRGLQAGESLPQGASVTITPMANGAIDPDMGFVANAIGDAPYDFIAHPYSGVSQLAMFTSLMNDATGRWAWNRQDYGHIFTMQPGTISSLLTTGGTINDQHQTIVGVDGSPSPPWDWATDWTGAVAVSTRALASRPLQTLSMQTVLAPQQENWWNYASQQQLLSNGIAVPGFSSYSNPTIVRSVTTYQRNAFGVADQSYLDVETMFTLMAITRQLKAALTQKYPRAILVPNGTPAGPGSPFVSPQDIKAEIGVQYNLMQAAGLVTSAAFMLANTQVQINAANPDRCDILWTPALAQGLRMFAVNNQFTLNPSTAS
ncbi:MAG TPA: phage tail sheath C-terminal domain-containing protein [Acidocella sp.]|jgi:phage tail sheath gpL-like|uniref:phage tail sheath C-terminal domain-containing protein n=1 Tax=Acidocella sp. TaxID=50710 RepID=UPI002B71BCF2|nr:phage tail sheath C-terminal domain-containing protein [Acidocella sp.]HVE20653.1 phage tail sheath C-terminal domain-containing protein [Acidocella sp.]